MDETRDELPEENQAPIKTPWQITKESWYDKIPVTLKQMDTIVTVCWILLALVAVVIVLDAMDIFNPFEYF